MTGYGLTYVTAAGPEVAERLARRLVEEKLAACVNIVPGVTSIYRWNDAVEQASEAWLIIKSLRRRWEAIRLLVEAEHDYDVPEIVHIPIEGGSEAYLKWLGASSSAEDETPVD